MFLRFASILSGMLILHNSAAVAAIYFAAEQPPLPISAPTEAPLCYKFQDTVSLEEQLGKLKVKYGTAIFDEKIVKNEEGGRSLLAKKKDEETGITMEYFYSDNPTVCNEYKKQNTLDECFALKSFFGTCDEESKSSRWDTDGESYFLEADYAVSNIIRTKDFIHQGAKKKMVIFKSSPSSGYCGSSSCTEMIGVAIFSEKENTWKIDIFNKEFVMDYFPGGTPPSNSLKFKKLGKNGIAAIMEDVYPSIDISLDDGEQVYAYTTTTTIIGFVNNKLHYLLSLTTAEKKFYRNSDDHDRNHSEEYIHYDRVPFEWMSDIKYNDEEYKLSIHSYGTNEKGKYFDRTRRYALSEGKLKEVWRDDEKEVEKKDKDIDTLCQAVDAIDETSNLYYLKNTCALFKQGEMDGGFPLKSGILEDTCFFRYKNFSQESINTLCSSYDYDAAVMRYSLLSDSELRKKLKINIFPVQIENENVAYIRNSIPAYFDSYKKNILTERGVIETDQLKNEDKILIEDIAEDKVFNFLKLKNKIEIARDEEDGKIIPDSYLIIGDSPGKHIRLITPTYLSSPKEMPACFLSNGEKWKLKESAVYSALGLKRKIYSGILINSSSEQTLNRIVSADDKGNCAKLFESKESPFLFLKTVLEIKDGKQVENWLIFRGATDLALRYHENDNAVFSLANKNDYEYSSWIR